LPAGPAWLGAHLQDFRTRHAENYIGAKLV
jgi:hypothetical protein